MKYLAIEGRGEAHRELLTFRAEMFGALVIRGNRLSSPMRISAALAWPGLKNYTIMVLLGFLSLASIDVSFLFCLWEDLFMFFAMAQSLSIHETSPTEAFAQ